MGNQLSGEISFSSEPNKEPEQEVVEEVTILKKRRHDPGEKRSVMRNHRPNNGVFSAFMVRPSGVSLEVQDEDEEILLLVRQHPIVNLRWVFLAVVLSLLPILFMTMPTWNLLPARFQFMTGVFWFLFVLVIVIEGFLSWYFDVFVVTDERIIDIDFKNLIYKNITTTKIDNIEDVTYSVSGPIPSLLNFGNVVVQTAGAVVSTRPNETVPAMEVVNTPQPALVAKLINEMMLEEEQEKIEGRVR